MSFVPSLISGIGALGGLFGNRGSTQQQSGTQQSNSGYLNMPALTAEGTGVLYPTADAFLKNLGTDTDLSGYKANQQMELNNLDLVKQNALKYEMARRGIDESSPYAIAAKQNTANQKFQDTTKLNNSIPLLAQQILQSKIGQGIDLFRSIPEGTSGSSYSNTAQQGNVTQPGNQLGGLFGTLGPILAFLYGNGAFGGGSNPTANAYNAPTQSR